jgi:hypothetical protein
MKLRAAKLTYLVGINISGYFNTDFVYKEIQYYGIIIDVCVSVKCIAYSEIYTIVILRIKNENTL